MKLSDIPEIVRLSNSRDQLKELAKMLDIAEKNDLPASVVVDGIQHPIPKGALKTTYANEALIDLKRVESLLTELGVSDFDDDDGIPF